MLVGKGGDVHIGGEKKNCKEETRIKAKKGQKQRRVVVGLVKFMGIGQKAQEAYSNCELWFSTRNESYFLWIFKGARRPFRSQFSPFPTLIARQHIAVLLYVYKLPLFSPSLFRRSNRKNYRRYVTLWGANVGYVIFIRSRNCWGRPRNRRFEHFEGSPFNFTTRAICFGSLLETSITE